jgi:hypothetical protein
MNSIYEAGTCVTAVSPQKTTDELGVGRDRAGITEINNIDRMSSLPATKPGHLWKLTTKNVNRCICIMPHCIPTYSTCHYALNVSVCCCIYVLLLQVGIRLQLVFFVALDPTRHHQVCEGRPLEATCCSLIKVEGGTHAESTSGQIPNCAVRYHATCAAARYLHRQLLPAPGSKVWCDPLNASFHC